MKKNQYFLDFFYKTEAGHVLKMFLTFRPISASRSYKLGSYKKKKRVSCQSNTTLEISIRSPVTSLLNTFRWPNLKNKKSFKNFIEKSTSWAQSHLCSFIRLEMTIKWNEGIHIEMTRKKLILPSLNVVFLTLMHSF